MKTVSLNTLAKEVISANPGKDRSFLKSLARSYAAFYGRSQADQDKIASIVSKLIQR
jgi:hypothetical protein